MPLNGTHKTNVTSIETAIATAIASLNPTADNAQRGALAILDRMRRDLELLRVERSQ